MLGSTYFLGRPPPSEVPTHVVAKRTAVFEHHAFLTEIQIVCVPTEHQPGERIHAARCLTRPCGTQDGGFGVQSSTWRNQPEGLRFRAAHGPAVGLADSKLQTGFRRERLPRG